MWGTCLGHQLLQILAANTSYDELLVQTDAVVCVPSFLHAKIQHASLCGKRCHRCGVLRAYFWQILNW